MRSSFSIENSAIGPQQLLSDVCMCIRTDAGLRNRVFGDNSSSQSADSQKNPVSLGLMGKFPTIYHCEALSVIARNVSEAISYESNLRIYFFSASVFWTELIH
ncbi:MAG: hypothetical protein JGK24_12640 [Microcoleus sp. PH2017_29_MFU_D_A]|uniref:hypothetical protein n=1 Tax=unclassified Microcoleus TaxID=2642155 RepID=UPI001E07A4DF|nr:MULTISPECIES: hypothetical protein [unclassified Microcoleus]MCC3419208.1 hypothetical protein [Microcoleus sp. PH2017_07_MST_O_A]MCC3432865.1 hypothetical protein [Microcoleus sp. PH2017_04_SCI_O_A]MCC3444510.1 hypothetical protein [Microcoleus sp. PH2017_03_ELD_O_A]MCC3465600.1 hypothetical protein [Microcoleus sp. PH2017_06_SFM_O_A]MCC3504385.1 hypothetical protein [Microcoleus sp. PH2017_19_SFW_U_A]MCC3509937.1 hypothetical protein [Microcoleus sp. PH2017_17_BER_D_A]TAE14017.1 MAG: hy